MADEAYNNLMIVVQQFPTIIQDTVHCKVVFTHNI